MGNRLAVIAGPTAVGKGTVVRYILEHFDNFMVSVSATTRAPRDGEVNGVDYYFLTDQEFDRMIQDGDMLEYAVVHGKHKYGTPRQPVEQALSEGKKVILEIDLQGARQVKQSWPDVQMIFIAPPSWDELRRRLASRGTESTAEQEIRLETAKIELAAQGEFDHVVVNDDVAVCALKVVDLIGQ